MRAPPGPAGRAGWASPHSPANAGPGHDPLPAMSRTRLLLRTSGDRAKDETRSQPRVILGIAQWAAPASCFTRPTGGVKQIAHPAEVREAEDVLQARARFAKHETQPVSYHFFSNRFRKLTPQVPEVCSLCPCSTYPHPRDYMLDLAFALLTRLIYFCSGGFVPQDSPERSRSAPGNPSRIPQGCEHPPNGDHHASQQHL